jgi:hypothetical protein
MAPLNFQIAKIAHNRNVRKLDEVWSTVTFAQEPPFTGVTPSLEIGRISAVLNEADDVILHSQEVHAHHRRWPVAVTAGYCEGSFGIRGHVVASRPVFLRLINYDLHDKGEVIIHRRTPCILVVQ